MDLLSRSTGQTSSLYLKPWQVYIFEDWPFSLYIVAASESDEGLILFRWLPTSCNSQYCKHFWIFFMMKSSHIGQSTVSGPPCVIFGIPCGVCGFLYVWCLVFHIWCKVFHVRYLMSHVWYLVFHVFYLVLHVWYLVFHVFCLLLQLWWVVFHVWYLVFQVLKV